jgi:hypothetical protein
MPLEVTPLEVERTKVGSRPGMARSEWVHFPPVPVPLGLTKLGHL